VTCYGNDVDNMRHVTCAVDSIDELRPRLWHIGPIIIQKIY